MQTFLPYPSFELSARVLDDKRLGKQRVECLQILKALQPPEVCPGCQGSKTVSIRWIKSGHQNVVQCPRCRAAGYLPRAWSNHPATRMWRGYENALIYYGQVICDEWMERGYDDTCRDKLFQYATQNLPCIPWLGSDKLHSSHRAALLYKLPSHYSQFGWTETPKQDYYWPV